MKKRLLSVCLAAFLVLASSVTALAEDRQGASGWQVTFDGKQLDSNFSSADMDDEIYAMQPGDSVELTISLASTYDGEADWYMENKVLETLEDAGDAEGGAYDYLLTYTDGEGETTTLYSSELFGGDGRINGVGLHGATATLEDYFYLDRLDKGEAGTVKLKVALDGETLVNDYQNTLARLQMNFAVEKAEAAAGTGTQAGGSTANTVRTGDQSRTLLFIILALASGLILLLLAAMRLSRGREEEDAVNAENGKEREGARPGGSQAGRRRRN